MARKRKTLPKNFAELLKAADLDELIAVFDLCELDARGGHHKATALGFAEAPDELVRWLVGQGLDPDTRDSYGQTPLASRAVKWRVPASQIPLFVALGAEVDAPSKGGLTPLQVAVQNCADYAAGLLLDHGAAVSGDGWDVTTLLVRTLKGVQNVDIPGAAGVSRLLIERGAEVTESMRAAVTRIGENFERYRSVFATDSIDETDAALSELYRLFDVAPASARVFHDGTSPIAVPAGSWSEQHAALWDLLVPGSGPAKTQQGEVIRITGKISDEMFRNGGANWDAQYRALVDAAARLMRGGTALPSASLAELDAAVSDVRRGRGSDGSLRTFTRLGVEWVALNPAPVELGEVDYIR